jgi:hypothetical protein
MAVHYYNLKVVMCRERGDEEAVGSKTYSEPTRDEWNITFASSDVGESDAKVEFLAYFDAELAKAPQHISKLKASGAGSLRGALRGASDAATTGAATIQNDDVATVGPFSERVGKDVFRYEIGVSGISEALALSNRTAHNLS